MKTTALTLTISILTILFATTVLADEQEPTEPTTLAEALKKGKVTVALRYRFENVDDENFAKDAHASTLRTTLAYATAPYKGFSLLLEAENVAEIGNDLYNNAGAGDLRNGVFDRPVVADPALTELNQVYLRYVTGDTNLALGRQEINLGDHRFVGNVGWRQHHQSFDAFALTNTSLDRVTFKYGYIDKVHRIFGDGQSMSSHYLNAIFEAGPVGKITLYGYLLDYDRILPLSTTTFGAELAGSQEIGNGNRLLYELEYADQTDTSDNPLDIDAGYLFASLGVKLPAVTIKAGWEVLEGNARDGQFRTPLATLHKFNGWADKFLATPTNGLVDLYLALSGKAGKVGWTAVYHDFSADEGGAEYGEEIDLQLTYKTPWQQAFGLKAAFYDADRFSSDTDKIWFWTAYKF